MNKTLRNTLLITLGLLSANVAMANDAIFGALIGGGAGALIGRSVGGRDGTIIGGALGAAAGAAIGSENRHHRVEQRVDYYAPAPTYYTQETYYPQQVYYSEPVRVEQRPVYYIEGGYDRGERWHHRDRDWDRHDRRDWGREHRGWDDHRR